MPIVDHVTSMAAGRAGQRGGKYSKHCSLPSARTTNVTAPADTPQWWLPHLFLQWRAGCAEACWLSREKLGLPFNALEPGKLAAY
jgi:hypothetical protein